MLIVRADGNAKIGAGHLMRCLTIGEAVRMYTSRTYASGTGAKAVSEVASEAVSEDGILFLCADEDSAALVERHGFRTGVLHTDYRRPETELAGWEPWINGSRNIILVDSYYVTDDYLTAISRYGRVWLMDDMQRHAYPVDGVINYNLFADKTVYETLYTAGDVRLCLGGDYIPLREQFRGVSYHVKDRVQNILITTGGGDADNIAGAVLDEIYREDIVYHVLVGRFSPHFESWRKRARAEQNIRICFDVQNMAELMCGCDLAVSAGGSTLYELAAVGVPFVCFSYAENQEALVEYFGRTQAVCSAGAWHRDAPDVCARLRQQFDRLCADCALRQQYSERERLLVDGRGAYRLAEVLCGGSE